MHHRQALLQVRLSEELANLLSLNVLVPDFILKLPGGIVEQQCHCYISISGAAGSREPGQWPLPGVVKGEAIAVGGGSQTDNSRNTPFRMKSLGKEENA